MSRRQQLVLYFGAVLCMAVAFGVHDSIFNNFLSETYDLSAAARGRLEFPRELPGFLVVLTTGVLAALAINHLGVVAALTFAAGTAGMGVWGDSSYGAMVVMMMVASMGLHLLMPVASTIALSLSEPGNRGKRMGQAAACATIGTVIGTGSIWLAFRGHTNYRIGFLCAAVIAALVAGIYAAMRMPHLRQERARMVFRKRYGFYYLLEFLFGARKQIFITFGFWVLVEVYQQPASQIAKLLMLSSLIGIGWKPLVGIAIDRFGERAIMIAEGVLVALICVGYGYALHLTGDLDTARPIACACFIGDDLLFALGTARAVYASRLTGSAPELTSTLAMGVSANHIASMLLPTVGGLIWVALGYERVFVIAALLALATSAVATRVPGKKATG